MRHTKNVCLNTMKPRGEISTKRHAWEKRGKMRKEGKDETQRRAILCKYRKDETRLITTRRVSFRSKYQQALFEAWRRLPAGTLPCGKPSKISAKSCASFDVQARVPRGYKLRLIWVDSGNCLSAKKKILLTVVPSLKIIETKYEIDGTFGTI